ncbi:hypothetical protein Hanom_Chr05g00476301 [Helianthus anomalus]
MSARFKKYEIYPCECRQVPWQTCHQEQYFCLQQYAPIPIPSQLSTHRYPVFNRKCLNCPPRMKNYGQIGNEVLKRSQIGICSANFTKQGTLFLKFTKTKWLSVPPDTRSYPLSIKLCRNM